MKDILLAIFFVLILIPIFHFFSNIAPNIYSTTFFFLIMVPTLMTLINGAPFVPTPMEAVRKMIKLAKIKKGDVVYDIGCGDGRMVYVAANEYGARATGLELSPLVYTFARIRKLLWRSKAKILFRNFKTQNLRDADVIVCYLMPETLEKLRPKLETELKPGAMVVSYAFRMASWKETHQEPKDAAKNISPIWIYKR
jgi:cyclopropane fatty-acyl-phospholipid synthase-like methyltransferase